MSSTQKVRNGWREQVARKGVRLSRVFPTKAAAQAWGRQMEAEIVEGRRRPSNLTVGDLLDRYAREISPAKKGAKWEQTRIQALRTLRIAQEPLSSVDATHIAKWRDERLQSVSAGTVLREWTLLSHAFQIAVREWKWLAASPMTGVRRPVEPPPRERLISDDERDRLLHVFGDNLNTVTGRVGAALVLALETGMRAGELCGLTWDRVDLDKRVATLPMTKNGSARQVPLSPGAVEVLQKLGQLPKSAEVLRMNVQQLDAIWRKGRDKAGIVDLHFHDSRATAVTRLARKLDILDLARMIGHRDIRSLTIYFRATAEDIAKKLD